MRLLDGNKFTIGYRNPFVGGGDDLDGERGHVPLEVCHEAHGHGSL